ncbi:MAG: glycoside hydrolase N-terminal domain-containing protein [Bacteroidaceae bacterium]|nr:glycoside hydrolase N-terminal domain-containing protein [Bacteroidaceae bacterium]
MFKKIYLSLIALCAATLLNAQTVPPTFSSEAEPVWYYIQFKTGSACLNDQGSDNNLQTATKANQDSQKWQFIGSLENFYLRSKAGNYVNYANSRFTSSSTNKVALKLVESTNAAGGWELQRTSSSSSMNQWGGSGAGKELGEWSAGDSNNPIDLVAASAIPPIFSLEGGEEEWYFVEFAINSGGASFEDMGTGNKVNFKPTDYKDAQLWKFVGTKDNFQLVSKSGNYAAVTGSGDNARVITQSSQYTPGFKFVETTGSTWGGRFEIHSNDASFNGKGMNRWGGGELATSEIGFWNLGDNNNPVNLIALKYAKFPDFSISGIESYTPENKHTLWYNKPATVTASSDKWMEYSLPIGNGQLGASLFGGVYIDEILFNEKTLWSGGPDSYGYYLCFGSFYAEDISGEFSFGSETPVKDYYRQLDLSNATGTVSYKSNDGSVTYTRQYIASNPDNCIAVLYTADREGKISLRFTMQSGKPGVVATTKYADGTAAFNGKLNTVSYAANLKVINDGGTITTTDEGIEVKNANSVKVILAAGTDFSAENTSHVNGKAASLASDMKAHAAEVASKEWDEIHSAHVTDFRKYFNRVTFDLAGTENTIPTNELVDKYNRTPASYRMLEQLYFHYGRYLEISSSRGVDLPSNLQGIWNNSSTPPWHSDIHANINVQMNYWPAEPTNLSEMHMPFLNYIINEASQPEWKNRAIVAGESRGWTCLTENNIFGGISGFAPNYVIANAWYVTHLWQHYRYTLDKEFLAKAFPAMLSASQFWADRVELAEDGTYECPNEYSPEHGPGAEDGVAHAQQLVWELFDNTLKAVEILGKENCGITEEDYALITDRFSKLDNGIKTEMYLGQWGTTYNDVRMNQKIMREWKYSSFTVSSDKSHRHMSHLMCLYPYAQVTPSSGEYFDAAINSMKLRGDESTGWSMGWKINLWARALNGDRSHAILQKALKHSTSYGTNQYAGGIYYNLYDSHAPFQIDGNFGACAGIAEMLLQSHSDTLQILPALPSAWADGSVSGLKAVGDFTVSVDWSNGNAAKITIDNNRGQACYVNYAGIDKALVKVNGIEVKVNKVGDNTYQIPSVAGDEIVVDFTRTPTGISNNFFDKADRNKIYDLTGRQVDNPTVKGVYIKGGEKFIVE